MNILYIAAMRFPNEKAHGKQVKEVCNALASVADVTLVVPTRKTEGDARSFGLSERVRFVRIPTPDLVRFGRVGFFITLSWFALGSAMYALAHRRQSIVLTREYVCALAPSILRMPTAWESHRGEWNGVVRAALWCGARLVVISRGLRDMYVEKGVPSEIILVAPDGVDLSRYEDLPTRARARATLNFSADIPIVLYNGHLHTWKGAGTLAQAAAYLPENTRILFMGGTDEDVATFRETYGPDAHIMLLGRKGDTERPVYLCAANVLMLPNTAKDEISVKYTSPLKLFGYMASGTPIVASDLPSIREIVSENEVFFAAPDNPESFASAIKDVLSKPDEAERRAGAARRLVAQYDWKHRARAVVDWMRSISTL